MGGFLKSIILYPENDRYVLKRIFKIFNSKGLKADASKIDRNWNLEQLTALYAVLDVYSHVFIILSSENFNDVWFTGLLSYIIGSNKGCYFYLTENDNSMNRILSKFNFGQGYDSVENYADSEFERWSGIQRKEIARNKLIDNGFALSTDAMGECISTGQLEIMQNFIDAGFSASSRNNKGVPMLCLAVRGRFYDIVKYLIDIGADINAVSEDRHNTPIMDAASEGELNIVKLLVSEGADLENISKNGQTALILAVGAGFIDISTFLITAGADYEIKDYLGMSAKSYANLFKQDEILKYMK